MDKELVRNYLQQEFERYISLLKEMVEINSFTSNASGVNGLGEKTIDIFADLGFMAERIPSINPIFGNHIVMRSPGMGGQEKLTVGLITHLDTVFPEEEERQNNFHWQVEGDRIFGPGTVDIKGGTIVIYMLLDAIREYRPQLFDAVNWVILFNAAEEALDPQFGDICRQYLEKDSIAALVFESGRIRDGQYSLVTARKGRISYRITSEGKGAHAGGGHRKGSNAITCLADVVSEIGTLTDYERNLTYNIGTIAGGTVINRVPHFAEARGEMRAFEIDVLERGEQQLLAVEQKHSRPNSQNRYPCKIRIDIQNRWRPWPVNEQSIGLYSIWQEAATELGYQVVADQSGGLSDANWLWDHIPTMDGLGPDGGNAHSSERNEDRTKEQEYVRVSSFIPKALINIWAINRLVENYLNLGRS